MKSGIVKEVKRVKVIKGNAHTTLNLLTSLTYLLTHSCPGIDICFGIDKMKFT